jgi:hypothetical protein
MTPMCFGRVEVPKPKPAPLPPDPKQAVFEGISEQRRALASGVGRRDTFLTRLRDEDVAASATKKTLGGA